MSILAVLTKKMFGLLHSLLVCFKRVLCFLKPRKRSDDLPFTVSSQDPVYSLDGLTANIPHAQTWDGWSDKPFSNPVEDKINEYRKKVATERELLARRNTLEDDEEAEPDYFNDMTPAVKKTKKILLKQKQERNHRDLFAVSTEPDIPMGAVDELGLMDDVAAATGNDAWGDMDDDLDVDSVLKEQRQRERLERQQRRKAEHGTRQHQPGQQKRLEAVRISFDS